MAHELSFVNGVGQMFASVQGGTPWHQEGIRIDGDQVYDFDAVIGAFFTYPTGPLTTPRG